MKMIMSRGQEMRTVKAGFSWTTLFFGCLVPLVRGDFKWALIMILCSFFTCGISLLVFPFIYNRIYIRELQSQGFAVRGC